MHGRARALGESGNFLANLVFINFEVFGLETIHVFVFLIEHGEAEHDHIHLNVEGGLIGLLRPQPKARRQGGYQTGRKDARYYVLHNFSLVSRPIHSCGLRAVLPDIDCQCT